MTPRRSSPVAFKRKMQDEDDAMLFSMRSNEGTPSFRSSRRRRKMAPQESPSEEEPRSSHEIQSDADSQAGWTSSVTESDSEALKGKDSLGVGRMAAMDSGTDWTPRKPVALKGNRTFLFDSEDDDASVKPGNAFTRARFQSGGAFTVFGSTDAAMGGITTPKSKDFASFRGKEYIVSDDEDEFWKSPPSKMQNSSAKNSRPSSRTSSKRSSPVPFARKGLSRKLNLNLNAAPRSAPSTSSKSENAQSWWKLKGKGDVAHKRNLFGANGPATTRRPRSRNGRSAAIASPGSQWKVSELAKWMETQGIGSPPPKAVMQFDHQELAETLRRKLSEDLVADGEEDEEGMMRCDAVATPDVFRVDDDQRIGRVTAGVAKIILEKVYEMGDTEGLFPSLFVSKQWSRMAQKILWASPKFFSLNGMMAMHKILYGVGHQGVPPVAEKVVEVVVEEKPKSTDLFNGLRGMLGIGKKEKPALEDPRRFLFKDEEESISSGRTTPMMSGMCRPELAKQVRSLAFHLFNPTDRRFPVNFDVQSFIADGLPRLKELKVLGSPDWVDSFMLSLMASSTSLRQNLEVLELHAGAAEKISRDAMVVHLGRFQKLKRLVMGGSWAIADDALKSVAMGCQHLVTLALWRCPQITDAGLMSVIEKCTELKTLEVGHCAGVTDKLLFAMSGMKSLQLHTLSLCHLSSTKVTQDALVALLAPASGTGLKLVKLSLNGFHGLTPHAVALIATRLAPTLRYLTLHESISLQHETPSSMRIFLGFLSHIRILDISAAFGDDVEAKEAFKEVAKVLGLEGNVMAS
ncbi:hypothetical protein HDU97_001822 [Phlyctochytrium planicorne]|nr:hypothetical protein HDU97_001822 [Phlyctochytrium planicorne]